MPLESSGHTDKSPRVDTAIVEFLEAASPSAVELLIELCAQEWQHDLAECTRLDHDHKLSASDIHRVLECLYSSCGARRVNASLQVLSELLDSSARVPNLPSNCRPQLSIAAGLGPKELKVWLGFVKLDNKIPTLQALQQMLYGSDGSSAHDADVIALFVTDLYVTSDNVDKLRWMLRKALNNPEDYVVNEEDEALSLKHIPARLMKADEDGARHVSMSVAVHKRNIAHCDQHAGLNYRACFPVPSHITCLSPKKNASTPAWKSVLAQDVTLRCNGRSLDLVLLGANLDTNEQAKLVQLNAVDRLLRLRKRGRSFVALMWGDFNNRVVAFHGLRPHVTETSGGKFTLLESGAQMLADMISNPDRRLELLRKDCLVFSGKDLNGQEFTVSPCNERLSQLFSLHIEPACRGTVPVPLPSYKRSPLDFLISQCIDTRVSLEDVACIDEVHCRPPRCYPGTDLFEDYFGWQRNGKWLQRVLKSDTQSETASDSNLCLQLGWPDGVGIHKGNTVEAELLTWETDAGVQAYDHLPMRSVVSVHVHEGCQLKVWLGFVKLVYKFPTQRALNKLLYGTATSSAEDADIIALFVTDLLITPDNIGDLRLMLRKALKNPDQYIVNEEDNALCLQNIPAKLISTSQDAARYISMSVAVHKSWVTDNDKDGILDHYECFPIPANVTCLSPRKNALVPAWKSVLQQDVTLTCGEQTVQLVLLGANLDTDDEARLVQLQALGRLLACSKRCSKFCALMWGDFNNRLIAYEDLRPHMEEQPGGKWELLESGAHLLANMIRDPVGRIDLLHKDSLCFLGKDVSGQEVVRSKSNEKLRSLFTLHLDAVFEATVPVPVPSYKHTPLEYQLSQSFGTPLRLEDFTCLDLLKFPSSTESLGVNLPMAYFGWESNGKYLQRMIKKDKHAYENQEERDLLLQLGWLDGVGVYRGSTVPTEIIAWDTEPKLYAYDHVPLRSVVRITM